MKIENLLKLKTWLSLRNNIQIVFLTEFYWDANM